MSFHLCLGFILYFSVYGISSSIIIVMKKVPGFGEFLGIFLFFFQLLSVSFHSGSSNSHIPNGAISFYIVFFPYTILNLIFSYKFHIYFSIRVLLLIYVSSSLFAVSVLYLYWICLVSLPNLSSHFQMKSKKKERRKKRRDK